MPLYEQDTTNRQAAFAPSDHSLAGWSFDPVNLQAGVLQLGGGNLQVVRLKVTNATLISNLYINLTAGGITLVSGRNQIGFYSDDGALLGQAADQTSAWSSSGMKTMALITPVEVTPWTWYKVAWFNNGLTAPAMSRGQNTSATVLNAGMSGGNLRYSTAQSGLTTALPSNIGTMTPADIAWWVAVS